MSMISDLKASLSSAAMLFTDDTAIEYETLTSNPNADTRTYGTWTAITGARTCDYEQRQVRAEDSQWYREFTCHLRVPSGSAVTLTLKDRVRTGGATGKIWAIRELSRSGATAMQDYTLAYRIPMMTDSRQEVGV